MLYGELPQRAYDLQTMLDKAYEQAADPKLSSGEQRALDKTISAMECELSQILDNKAQAQSPGGYYTEEGFLPATGRVVASPALVLGEKDVEPKKNPLPWIAIALIAAGATYFTLKG